MEIPLAARPLILTPYYDVIYWILIVESILVLLLAMVGISLQWYLRKSREKKQRKRTYIKDRLTNFLESDSSLDAPFLRSLKGSIPWLLPAIFDVNQSMDKTDKQSAWHHIRQGIAENILGPAGRRWAYHRRWTKQLLAARCLTLDSQKENESAILHLLKQKIPIVKYTAAHAAVRLGTPNAIEAILEAMNQSTHYLRQPYRDALRNGGDRVYYYLGKKLETETDPLVRVSCLEVLSENMNEHIARLLEPDLKSPHKNLRIAAARALGHYPEFSSVDQLIPLLSDPDWEVKAIAARSLGYFKLRKAINHLVPLCRDPVWWVRMNAALALKRIGDIGIDRLKEFKPEVDRFAYETAQYVLALEEQE